MELLTLLLRNDADVLQTFIYGNPLDLIVKPSHSSVHQNCSRISLKLFVLPQTYLLFQLPHRFLARSILLLFDDKQHGSQSAQLEKHQLCARQISVLLNLCICVSISMFQRRILLVCLPSFHPPLHICIHLFCNTCTQTNCYIFLFH